MLTTLYLSSRRAYCRPVGTVVFIVLVPSALLVTVGVVLRALIPNVYASLTPAPDGIFPPTAGSATLPRTSYNLYVVPWVKLSKPFASASLDSDIFIILPFLFVKTYFLPGYTPKICAVPFPSEA